MVDFTQQKWASYIVPVGKHKGETLAMVRMNDMDWFVWATENMKMEPLRTMLKEGMKYLEETDPWSIPHKSHYK